MKYATNRAALLAACSLATIFAVAGSGRMFADATDPAADPELTDDIIDTHRERQREIVLQSRAILDTAQKAQRDPDDKEGKQLDDLQDEFDTLEETINRRLGVLARERGVQKRDAAPRNRRTDASTNPDNLDDDNRGGRNKVVGPVAAKSGTFGFRHRGEFFQAVARASISRNADIDPRLMAAAASSISTEGAGPDGGFAVPPDFRTTIMERVTSEDSLLSRCDLQDSSTNSMTFPSDMTTPWQTSGGIQAYWEGEAQAIGQSKVNLQNVTVRLHKLAALVPVTEELLEDVPAMGSYVERKAAAKIDFKISHAIAWGNGVGMPLGFMNAACAVSQAAEGSQTADTINAENVVKMMGRLATPSRRTAI